MLAAGETASATMDDTDDAPDIADDLIEEVQEPPPPPLTTTEWVQTKMKSYVPILNGCMFEKNRSRGKCVDEIARKLSL